MDYTDRLKLLALNDAATAEALVGTDLECNELDPKTLSLVRLAALATVDGAVPSYGEHVDSALNAGASAEEIVAVLVSLVPVVGLPRVVTAAPKLAMALGYDTDDALQG